MLTRGTVRPSKTGRGGAASFAWAAALVATLLAVSLVLAPTCLASPASAPAAAPPPAGGSTATSQGAPLSIEDNPTGYVGALQVADTGVYQMGARAYSPAEGRFLTYDLCRPTQNRYAYTGGDPVNRVDPTGCSWFWSGVLKVLENPITQWALTAVTLVSGVGEFVAARRIAGLALAWMDLPAVLNVASGAMGIALLANNSKHFMSKGWEEGLAIADTAFGVAALGVGVRQISSNLAGRVRSAREIGGDDETARLLRPVPGDPQVPERLERLLERMERPGQPPSVNFRTNELGEQVPIDSCNCLHVATSIHRGATGDTVDFETVPWNMDPRNARVLHNRFTQEKAGFRLSGILNPGASHSVTGGVEGALRSVMKHESTNAVIVRIEDVDRLLPFEHAVTVVEEEGRLWVIDPQVLARPIHTDTELLAHYWTRPTRLEVYVKDARLSHFGTWSKPPPTVWSAPN